MEYGTALLAGPDFAAMAYLALFQALGSQSEVCSSEVTQNQTEASRKPTVSK